MKQFYVYILANKRNGTIYVGVTSDLQERVWQHKEGFVEGFTKKYNVKLLVYYEIHESDESALVREKTLKKWKRTLKLRLIEKNNPNWDDLYDTL